MEGYDAAYAAAASGVSAVYAILSLAISVLTLVAMWKLFVKAGRAGWKCLIPFYNTYCLYDIAWGKWMVIPADVCSLCERCCRNHDALQVS